VRCRRLRQTSSSSARAWVAKALLLATLQRSADESAAACRWLGLHRTDEPGREFLFGGWLREAPHGS